MSRSETDSSNGNGTFTQVPTALLSCQSCRRRKVRCDKELPSCSLCMKSSQTCTYPPGPLKPGPKLGSSQRSLNQRSLKRPRRSKEEAGDQLVDDNGSRDAQQDNAIEHQRNNSWDQGLLCGTSTQWKPQSDPENDRMDETTHAITSDHNNHQSPGSTCSTTASRSDSTSLNLPALSSLIQPSHESAQQTLAGEDDSKEVTTPVYGDEICSKSAKNVMFSQICDMFQIPQETVSHLIDSYFTNMTAFSLFQRPSFEAKLYAISAPIHRHALLASMFCFSVRFGYPENSSSDTTYQPPPTPESFWDIAVQLIDQALHHCGDEAPPLCLLQAMVLTTFQQLVKGVRGRAWRSLGTCVRIAYELQLNLIDIQRVDYSGELSPERVAKWCADEERRRVWWTIWEFDVFACSIKLGPTAIDWAENKTMLPVDDDDWFNRRPRPSCLMELDPTDRWKRLQLSGNESPKAWFIVVNSFMRNAHLLSDRLASYGANGPNQDILTGLGAIDAAHQYDSDPWARLAMLANSLSCFCIALPRCLAYKDEYLSFSPSGRSSAFSSLQNDSAIHGIHVMTQLTRFKIYHHEFFNAASREASMALDQRQSNNHRGIEQVSHSLHPKADSFSAVSTPNSSAWKRYLDAADSILTIVSNSSIDHIKHVNPFLACTIWIAAAVQLVHRVFGPPGTNRRLLQSNFDRLRSNYTQYVTYWQTPTILLEKLNILGPRLERLRTPPQEGPHPWMRPGPPRRTQSAYTIPQDLEIRRDSDPRDPRGDGHARHSMSVMKDSTTPVQPYIGLLLQQQPDQVGSFVGDTAMQWPTRFDDSAIDSSAFVGMSDGQLDSFDFGLADNLDFSLANVLNWHSVE